MTNLRRNTKKVQIATKNEPSYGLKYPGLAGFLGWRDSYLDGRVTDTISDGSTPIIPPTPTTRTGIINFTIGTFDRLNSMAQDSAGNTYVCGQTSNTDIYITKYDTNGDLDTTFGSSGKIIVDYLSGFDTAFKIRLDSANNIYVCGTTTGGSGYNNIIALKYDSNGVSASAFGASGKLVIDLGSNATASCCAISEDTFKPGLFICGFYEASITNTDVFAIKVNSTTGAYDTDFGFGGLKTIDVAGVSGNDYIYDCNIDTNSNALYLVGESYDFFNSNLSIIALDGTFGNLYAPFDSIGYKLINLGGFRHYGRSIEVDSINNKLYICADYDVGSRFASAVLKLNTDGSFDAGFNIGTPYIFSNPAFSFNLYSIYYDNAGNVYCCGSLTTGSGPASISSHWVVKFTSSGNLDPTFGSGGQITIDVTGNGNLLQSIIVDSSNKIFVAGTSISVSPPPSFTCLIAKLLSDGNYDTTFGDAA